MQPWRADFFFRLNEINSMWSEQLYNTIIIDLFLPSTAEHNHALMYILPDMFACAEVPSHEPLQMGVMDYSDPAQGLRLYRDTEVILMVEAVFNSYCNLLYIGKCNYISGTFKQKWRSGSSINHIYDNY